jgi:signal transduction histidine kinase
VLRRCVRDLVALSTLPALWAQSDIPTVARSLADVLRRMLLLDVAYVRLRLSTGPFECCQTASGTANPELCAAMVHAVAPSESCDAFASAVDVRSLSEDGTMVRAVCTPLGYDAAAGYIISASARADFPSETDRLLLGVAANAAAIVIERRRAEEHLSEDKRVVDTLQRIGATLVSELDRQRLIQMVTDEATALTGAEFGAFFFNVSNPQGGSYMLYTLAGVPREAFANIPMPRATDLFGPTFRGEGPVRIADVTADPRYGRYAPHNGLPAGHPPVRSYLAVPVISRSGAVHGGLFFGHAAAGMFTDRHERLASGIAAWAALALDNADLYRDVQEASRAKDDFLATVSHELRTPLNAVLGWTAILSQGRLAEDRVQGAIAAIQRNARAQATLIEDLLDVSRFLAGRTSLDLGEVDVAETVEEAIDAVRLTASTKGITIHVEGPPDLRIRADATRLRQIVWNLASNAIKFTPSRGRIDVSSRRDGDYAVITVADTGQGIDPKFLPHVFDRFRQADVSTTREQGGLGLGLWIVRRLAELHGGSVTATSAGEGKGSTFTVRLPIAGAPVSRS